MADILFVTWDGGGNLPPALGIARELRRRGHLVRFLGHPGQGAVFAETELPFTAYAHARPFTSQVPASPWTLIGVLADPAMGSEVVAELQKRPADVVVVDCLLFGVMKALRKAGREYVVLEHSFDGYFRKAARGPMGLLLRLRGCRGLPLIDAGRPVLAATLPELDSGHGDHVLHTGPVLGSLGGPADPARSAEPTVLVSLSTFGFRSLVPTWQRILAAVEGLQARVVVTTGPAVDPTALRLPDNVEHHRWLPHTEVLPEVSLVVGHGGHATTMVTLAHDVPLLVLPLDPKTDQPAVGRAVQRAGAGRTMSRRSSPAEIRAAIEELVAPGAHHAAAARLGAAIRGLPGATNGADRIEELVDHGVQGGLVP